MRLRRTLLVLSFLAFFSATTGGYLYYDALREQAAAAADRRAAARVDILERNLSARLSENLRPAEALAAMDEMLEMLIRPGPEALAEANRTLDIFQAALRVDVCYLMNHEGVTVASSNRDSPDSFLGKNFAFRPYFQRAIHSAPATYLALGVTSRKRGAYHSFPIFEPGGDSPIGLAVVKVSIDQIERELGLTEDEVVLVTDPSGVIFIANRPDWLYRSLRPLPGAAAERIRRSRQFGAGPWEWIGLSMTGKNRARDAEGLGYRAHHKEVENYPEWRIYRLQRMDGISGSLAAPLVRVTGQVVLSLSFLVGLAVFFLYRKASREILKRRAVESALRESENRYRSLYHNTPAMLHSIDREGRLLSVSRHWSEVLGYPREEVLGRKLTDFLDPESRRYAEREAFPEFFRTGTCKDIPYRFVRKNGEVMDTLLSAIADRDEEGRIRRSLAVSIDVTERKRAVEALRLAKEELSRYSKDLERQVRERTREISSILRYTPDVVSIKDEAGRYLLINPRFEDLLGRTNEEVRGKTDYDLLPREVADQFRAGDRRVLRDRRSLQVEERFPHAGGVLHFLSVKFPIYDESGRPAGVCGISTDITPLKKTQDRLRRLSGSVILGQEQERAAIARELHDELGQVLTALRMEAVWLRNRLRERDSEASGRAGTLCDLIDSTIEEVRSLALRLRPGVLDTLGLVDALEWYTSDYERRTSVTCIFEHERIPPMDEALSTAAYRIAQEALTNVARHSGATRVDVSLTCRAGRLGLDVSDNGKGFDTGLLSDTEALGVAGMRERAALVGGTLQVLSGGAAGTRVRFRAPVKEEPSRREAAGGKGGG